MSAASQVERAVLVSIFGLGVENKKKKNGASPLVRGSLAGLTSEAFIGYITRLLAVNVTKWVFVTWAPASDVGFASPAVQVLATAPGFLTTGLPFRCVCGWQRSTRHAGTAGMSATNGSSCSF